MADPFPRPLPPLSPITNSVVREVLMKVEQLKRARQVAESARPAPALPKLPKLDDDRDITERRSAASGRG